MRYAYAAALILVVLPSVVRAQDILSRPVVYRLPGMDSVHVDERIVYKHTDDRALAMNVSTPVGPMPASGWPAIVFIHGGPGGRGAGRPPTDWGVYRSYVRLAAASGFVGVTFNFRYYDTTREGLERAMSDVSDAIAYVQKHAATLHVDPRRLCLWAFSGGGPMLTIALDTAREGVRCLVSYYAVLDAPEAGERFSPVTYPLPESFVMPPVFIARAGLDSPSINASVDAFVERARTEGFVFTVANHPTGRHGFDILDEDERSREIIATTFEFIRKHTAGDVAPETRLARRVAAVYAALRRGETALATRLADPAAWPGSDSTFLDRVTSEDAVYRLYFAMTSEDRRDKGVTLMEWLAARRPRSFTAFESLAAAYENAGRIEDARKAAGKALELLEASTDLPAEAKAGIRKRVEERLSRLTGRTDR